VVVIVQGAWREALGTWVPRVILVGRKCDGNGKGYEITYRWRMIGPAREDTVLREDLQVALVWKDLLHRTSPAYQTQWY